MNFININLLSYYTFFSELSLAILNHKVFSSPLLESQVTQVSTLVLSSGSSSSRLCHPQRRAYQESQRTLDRHANKPFRRFCSREIDLVFPDPLYSRDSEMASDKQRWHSSVSGKVEDGTLVARWRTGGDRGKG
ncbi:hypothetical protein BRARA_F01265 [Brassica rapa]|uniref:Uncharacterized protein n=1 Tax=Brassica campestris TaxID=3711 RepID=A0A397Z3P1_BRACM|nr:hypothetical protein BRARA_F01265 [Brassica rapa]